MQIKEVDLEKTEIFSIGRQYSNNVLVVHFVNLPNLNNKYIYYKIDDIEQEIPLVSDLFIVSRPLTMHSGKVKAQIIVRDESNETIDLTKNFTMIIEASNYSGIGENENYPDDPNIKNYFVKIDEKVNSFEELANLVQTKLDNGEFIGAQGPRGEKGDPGEKGEPGDVTDEYRNLASQIEQNASDAQTSATNAQTSASNAQKAFNDTKEFANQAKSEMNQIKTDTNTLKDEANTSAVNAKASETKAKEYADNLQSSTDDISKLKEDLGKSKEAIAELYDKKIAKFYANSLGETTLNDSDRGKIQNMILYGKSSQDGTPSPENPVEVKSVVNPVVKFTSEDGSKVQTVTLNNITLNAIPVSKGGNVTINGQQYIADYVDVERGKVIRNILKWSLCELKKGFNNVVWHMNISGLGIDGSKIGLSNMFKIQCGDYNGVKTSEIHISYDGTIASLNMRGMANEEFKKWLSDKNPEVYNVLKVAEEIPINQEEITALKELATYYHNTNIIVNSEQLDGYTIFNYPISMANGWNYVKQQLNDNRDYIYDMELQSAEAYVNSEYAVALTELEV